MNCDICGRESGLAEAIVEGALVNVCNECSKFGKVVVVKDKSEKIAVKEKKLKEEESNDIITYDYFKRIKESREKLGLTQEELASKIKVKESVINSLESGDIEPDLILAKRLETFLKIQLIGSHKFEADTKRINFRDKGLTIGDLLE